VVLEGIIVDDYSCVRHPLGHRLSESACERAHQMGVLFLSKMEMERCVPLCREDAHELGVSFSLRQRWNLVCPCVGKMPMSWVCRSL
jgi:hypothetical protein